MKRESVPVRVGSESGECAVVWAAAREHRKHEEEARVVECNI